jgi:uncharacterized protein YndB with AHSA1/START domain
VIEGDRVVHELVLPASRDAVFDMFVDPSQLVRWIGLSAELDPRPGGRFRFEIAPGQFCEGRYEEVDRPNRLVVSWGWTEPSMHVPPGSSRVEVQLGDAPGGTRLRLVHSQLPPDLRLLHDDGWRQFLARLVAVFGGSEAGPYPAGNPAQRLAELRREGGTG